MPATPLTFEALWTALAQTVQRSPLLVVGWMAFCAAFAVGSTALLRRVLPRTATDNPVRRLAQNSALPMAAALLNKALDLAFAIVLLRVLGPADAGKYAWIGIVIGYLDILLNFGMNTWLTREVARAPKELAGLLGRVLAARVVLWLGVAAVVALVCGPLAAPLAVDGEVATALLLLALAMIPSGLATALSSVFQGQERMEYPATVTIVTTALKVSLGLLALALGLGFVGLAAVALAVNSITLAALLVLFRDFLGGWPRLGWPWRAGLALGSATYPLMLNNLLASLFFRIDSFLLRPLAGDAALGWYSAAYRVVDGLNLIPAHFTLALFPRLARQADADRVGLARVYRRAIKVLLTLALPATVGIAVLAEPIIDLVAGPAYLPAAAWALQALIWFLPFSFVNGVTQYVLIALDRQRGLTAAFLLATLFNLGANLLLIPRLSYLGAAVVTVLSEIVLLGPFWWLIARELPPIGVLGVVWRPTLAAAGMGLVVWGMANWNALLSVPVGALVYLGLLLLLGGIDADDRALWRRLRGRPAA